MVANRTVRPAAPYQKVEYAKRTEWFAEFSPVHDGDGKVFDFLSQRPALGDANVDCALKAKNKQQQQRQQNRIYSAGRMPCLPMM